MKIILILLALLPIGCVTKTVCFNNNEGFRPVYDTERSCVVRIKQVVVGTDLDLPKSLSFGSSETKWAYRWVESSFKEGTLELGHFVLVPIFQGSAN